MTNSELAQGMVANTISLLLGHPDPTTLLTPELQRAVQSLLAQPYAYRALQYGPEHGTQALINFLVEKANREQMLSIGADQLMIVAGSTHAVDMIARLYAKPGGVVIVEAPTYADAIHIFRDHHLELHSVPMDENGLLVPELENLLARLQAEGKTPSFLYTIPNFHNPTGITLAYERRLEIIRLAHQYGFLIVEDDVYRHLAFEGQALTSFFALAEGQGVLSIGSFSKTLAPGLRLGWLMGSQEAVARLINCGTMQMGGGANPFAAQIVAEYCCQGHWEAHIAMLCGVYRKRRDVALSALRQYMPDGVNWTHPAGGFFIWLSLPSNVYAQDVKREAFGRGLALAAGEGFFVNPADGKHNLRIAFSFAAPQDIEKGVEILGETITALW